MGDGVGVGAVPRFVLMVRNARLNVSGLEARFLLGTRQLVVRRWYSSRGMCLPGRMYRMFGVNKPSVHARSSNRPYKGMRTVQYEQTKGRGRTLKSLVQGHSQYMLRYIICRKQPTSWCGKNLGIGKNEDTHSLEKDVPSRVELQLSRLSC